MTDPLQQHSSSTLSCHVPGWRRSWRRRSTSVLALCLCRPQPATLLTPCCWCCLHRGVTTVCHSNPYREDARFLWKRIPVEVKRVSCCDARARLRGAKDDGSAFLLHPCCMLRRTHHHTATKHAPRCTGQP
jgi:hypothetical protein